MTWTINRQIPRVSSATSGDISPDMTADLIVRTAQAAAITINNPTGSPADGEKIEIRLKDNGTGRAITFGSEYRALGIALPTTTVASKTMLMSFTRNDADTKWDLAALNEEA